MRKGSKGRGEKQANMVNDARTTLPCPSMDADDQEKIVSDLKLFALGSCCYCCFPREAKCMII